MDEDNIQIEDPDSYGTKKDENYSHQSLIMKAKQRIIELGQHELSEGVNETQHDPRTNTIKILYKEDSRKAFINAVKILRMLMECDYDPTASKEVEKLDTTLKKSKDKLISMQDKEWSALPLSTKKMYPSFCPGYLFKEFQYYQEYIELEIETNMHIFSEMNKLAKRLDYYSATMFEN